jgi:hypothetical protein
LSPLRFLLAFSPLLSLALTTTTTTTTITLTLDASTITP